MIQHNQKKVLRKFYRKNKVAKGEKRRLTNKELMNLYGRPKLTRKIRAQ